MRIVALLGVLALATPVTPALGAPEGTLTWGLHVTLATKWLDPSDTEAFINPFMVLYALHDALVKPMPGGDNTPSLAETWTTSKDGLSYEFVLRKGVKFHNGDPVTAEDVKFSFDRYHGAAAKLLKDRVREIQVVDPGRVRFNLKEPWPDFMTFYGTSATGAAWIVPKRHVEKVGDDAFKKAPIGAGPYRFVSFNPGIELVMEALEGSWRRTPAVKRLVFRSMPDETTRAAALKAGDVDIVYLLSGPVAEEIQRSPGLRLAAATPPGVVFLDLPEQWDPKSPWHTGACGWRPAMPSTVTPSIRRRPSASRARPDASSRASWSSRGPTTRRPTTRHEPNSSSPKPGIPRASTPETSRRFPPSSRWPRRWAATSRRWASGPGGARWSAPPSSPHGASTRSRA